MILDRLHVLNSNWIIEIVGTDICEKALNKAKLGEYSQFEVQRGLGVQQLVKYFIHQDSKWQVKDNLKKNIKFEKANLIQSLNDLGKLDLILYRNVLIYFDIETKSDILKRLYTMIPQDGNLILGGR